MKWGGYYKLNAYFYAPKDDPKHRTQWDQLYTEEELANKIRPLAEAGNESNADLFMPFIRSRRAIIFVLMIIMKLIWRNFRQNSNR